MEADGVADDGARRIMTFHDVRTVGDWVAAQPWADGERLVLWGEGLDALPALMSLARAPTRWRAGVDVSGVSDVAAWQAEGGHATTPRELGNVLSSALRRELSAIERAAPSIQAPLFVSAGARDATVPRSQTDAIVAALRSRGHPVEYMVAPDEGHDVLRRANQVELYARIARFLEAHGAAPDGQPAP